MVLSNRMKCLNIKKEEQILFLREVKKRLKLPWRRIASLIKVHRSMVYFYLNGHSKLPYAHYLRLSSLSGVKLSIINLVDIKNREANISKPKLSNKLAEFIGALAGDGHLNTITYEVSITLHKDLDKEYSKYILSAFEDLFGINARSQVQDEYHKIKCFCYSKRLVNFLSEKYAIPTGKKMNKLHIPHLIRKNEGLSKAYLRGLFDTDGSFHRHRKDDAMLGIFSGDFSFIQEIKQVLDTFNFPNYLNKKNLYIYNQKEIARFFSLIKPRNKKHLIKYAYYKKYGIVPLTKDLIQKV